MKTHNPLIGLFYALMLFEFLFSGLYFLGLAIQFWNLNYLITSCICFIIIWLIKHFTFHKKDEIITIIL